MAITCDVETLADLSRCYSCFTGAEVEAVKIYLLAVAAGLQDLTPQELITRAECYAACIPMGLQKPVETYLLCQIANAASP